MARLLCAVAALPLAGAYRGPVPRQPSPAPLQMWQAQLSSSTRYLDDDERISAYQALQVAYKVHDGQCRRDGQPFITHPVAVAELVASWGMDSQCVIAALLHDAVEDTPLTFAEVEEDFGSEVRALVQGVTRVSKMDPSKLDERTDLALASPEAETQALLASFSVGRRGEAARMGLHGESSAALLSQCGASDDLLRLLRACAGDWRVAVLKVADRLHNMRTLGAMAPQKRAKKALETERVFVPLAHYLGAHDVGKELAQLSARYRSDGLTGHRAWAARARSTLSGPPVQSAVDVLATVLRKVGVLVGSESVVATLCSLPASSVLGSSSSSSSGRGAHGHSHLVHAFKAPIIPRRELGSERRMRRLIQQLDEQMPDRGRALYVSLRPLHERLTRHQAVTMRETDWSPEGQ